VVREQMGLDAPLLSRYGRFVGQAVLHGDLGQSLSSWRPVAVLVAERFGNTLQLAVTAMALALVLGATFLTQMLLTGGNEELGWRGYLLPALQARWSSLTSSVVLGVIWALWHLPLFFMAGTSQSYMPFPGFLLFTIPLTVIFTWVHNQTGGSILLVMLLHGAVNTTLGLVRITVMDGWACAAWLVLAVLVTVLPGRGRSVRREPARRANKTDTVA
jgi:membrane protease YdiL (CAAX protease family)